MLITVMSCFKFYNSYVQWNKGGKVEHTRKARGETKQCFFQLASALLGSLSCSHFIISFHRYFLLLLTLLIPLHECRDHSKVFLCFGWSTTRHLSIQVAVSTFTQLGPN